MSREIFQSPSANVHSRRELGATFLEFTIVAPLVLFLVLAIAETARYLAVRGVVNAAANRAVLLAASDPGIIAYKMDGETNQEQAFTDAEAKVLAKVKELPMSLIGVNGDTPGSAGHISSIRLIMPPSNSNGDSLEKRFEDVPLQVEVTVSMRPIIPCLGAILNLSGGSPNCAAPVTQRFVATAFREPSKVLTMPTQVDCNGNPIGSPDYNQNCACKSLQYWDTTSPPGSCVCLPGLQMNSNGDCECSNPYNSVTSEGTCACDPAKFASSCSGAGQQVDTNSCSCVCNAASGFSGNGSSCSCSNSNHVVNSSGACACETTLPCDPANGSIFDPATCQCKCDTSKGFAGSGSSCACSSSVKSNQGGTCSCTAPASCPGYQSWNSTTCNCGSCPAESSYTWIKSNCQTGGGTWDTAACSCTCPAGASWITNGYNGWCGCSNPSQYWNGTACTCYGGMEDNGSGGCKCIDPNKQIVNNTSCQCTNLTTPCPNSAHKVNTSTCQCGCNP